MQSLEERLRVATSTTADANPDALDEEKWEIFFGRHSKLLAGESNGSLAKSLRLSRNLLSIVKGCQNCARHSPRNVDQHDGTSLELSCCAGTSVEDLEAEVADHQAEVATLERAHEEKMSELKV